MRLMLIFYQNTVQHQLQTFHPAVRQCHTNDSNEYMYLACVSGIMTLTRFTHLIELQATSFNRNYPITNTQFQFNPSYPFSARQMAYVHAIWIYLTMYL